MTSGARPGADLLGAALRPLKVAKYYAEGDELRRLRMRRDELRKFIRRSTPIVVREDRGINYVLDLRDDSEVTLWIWFYGRYEEPLLARAAACLTADGRGERPLEGKTFLDVGANIGTASLCALVRQGAARAVLFEPHPSNLRLLRMNLAANDLTDRGTVCATAVSDAAGEVTFEESTDNIGDHRVRDTSATAAGALGEEHRTTITVPAVTLDEGLSGAGVDPADVGLVWVDVQGHETHVLDGAADLLKTGAPWCVEFWPYGLDRAGALTRFIDTAKEHFSHAWDLGLPEGYELDVPTPAGRRIELTELESLAASIPAAEQSTNLLLVPKS
ncbi:MAG: FkbM family methyltransferase [Solirubrobacteraceae bacterium]|nr:FkbM family methyltransferase [Solirubrobacteraceae bacterium]